MILPKEKSFPKLVKELDKVFSIFIRQRDEKNGCITCGRKLPWKEADCGHYIRRGIMGTRWDEENCHLQCKKCNGWNEGEKDIYRKKLIERYGFLRVERLETLRHTTTKWSKSDLKFMIQNYNSKFTKI